MSVHMRSMRSRQSHFGAGSSTVHERSKGFTKR